EPYTPGVAQFSQDFDGVIDRSAEHFGPALEIGGDEGRVRRELGGEELDGFGERPPAILLQVPFGRADIAEEGLHLGFVFEQRAVEVAGIPVDKDTAEVENDG